MRHLAFLAALLIATPALAQNSTFPTAGGGITALTGDCTASGSGSQAITCTKTSGTAFGTAAVANTGTTGHTVPFTDGSNGWGGFQNFAGNAGVPTGAAWTLNNQTFESGSSPSSPSAGCGTGATISNISGTGAWQLNIGTTPSTTCTITMPAASHGWVCTGPDITTTTEYADTTGAGSTTSVAITFFSRVGVATAPTASDKIIMRCGGY